MNKMKKVLAVLILGIFLISNVSADASDVGDWIGKVTMDGVENNAGATVEVYIEGVKIASTTVGEYGSGYYLIHVEGETGDNVLFKVNGIDATTVAWSNGGNSRNKLNLTVTSPTSSSGGSSSGGGSSGSSNICYENWQCTDWSECDKSEIQTRQCNDINKCKTEKNKPLLSQSCTFTSLETDTNNFSNFLTGNVIGGISDFAKSQPGIVITIGIILAVCGAFAFFRFKK